MDQSTTYEPTVIGAVRRYWWMVVGGAAIAGLAGLLYTGSVANEYIAEASLLVEDPTGTQLFERATSGQPQRYVQDQLAILEAPATAELVLEAVPDTGEYTIADVLTSREIVGLGETDLIFVRYTAEDPEVAVRFANAYISVYRTQREAAAAASFDAAIEELDRAVADVDDELAATDLRILELKSALGGEELEVQLKQAITDVLEAGPNATEEDLAQIVARLQTLQLVRELGNATSELSLLFESRRDVMDRRSNLVIRRDQVNVDSALVSSGVSTFSEAVSAEPTTRVGRVVLLALALGALIGAAVAYSLTLRTQLFENRSQPEEILGAPLLSEIPKFERAGGGDSIPIVSSPASPAAEAFRFASEAVLARLARFYGPDGASKANMVAFTSAYLGEGKTVLSANTALAAAGRGRSVLLVDADFGDHALTRMLLGDVSSLPGVTDVVEQGKSAKEAAIPLKLDRSLNVSLLTRGTGDISAPEFFRSAETRAFFEEARGQYDFVFLDCPPLLQVSYASAAVELADAVAEVVTHNGLASAQREVIDRLNVIGAPLIGYLYNMAPPRAAMLERRGSMKDPLGRNSASTRS